MPSWVARRRRRRHLAGTERPVATLAVVKAGRGIIKTTTLQHPMKTAGQARAHQCHRHVALVGVVAVVAVAAVREAGREWEHGRIP